MTSARPFDLRAGSSMAAEVVRHGLLGHAGALRYVGRVRGVLLPAVEYERTDVRVNVPLVGSVEALADGPFRVLITLERPRLVVGDRPNGAATAETSR